MAAFASVDEYAEYHGEPVPAGSEATALAGLLNRASDRVRTLLRDLGGRVAWNPESGLPYGRTPWEQGRIRVIRDATCAQAKHMQLTGEATDGTPFAGGSFGPLTLAAADSGDGTGSDARFSADAREILIAAGLTSRRVRG